MRSNRPKRKGSEMFQLDPTQTRFIVDALLVNWELYEPEDRQTVKGIILALGFDLAELLADYGMKEN